jgi:hypothetical protein
MRARQAPYVMHAGLVSALVLAVAMPTWAASVPFTPTDDAQVVQTLPARATGSARAAGEARTLRTASRRTPTDLALAARVARGAIDRARLDGDPRELGAAQAALAPWWNEAQPPPAVRLLRATLRQAQHEFDSALVDLDALLRDTSAALPLQAQAELTRASVLQVLGRWAEAKQGCERLGSDRYASLGAAVAWTARVCITELTSLQGQAETAETSLAELARKAVGQDASWVALIRAELAQRRGDPRAQTFFQSALATRSDVYTLAAYADWLLDAGRPQEVLTLIDEGRDADALLLRRAIALHRLRDARARALTETLRERFAAARLRGDTLHRREEALLALHLEGDAPKALALAREQWARQKEPADLHLLVVTARAARQDEAAQPALSFAASTGYADVRLRGAGGPAR